MGSDTEREDIQNLVHISLKVLNNIITIPKVFFYKFRLFNLIKVQKSKLKCSPRME